MQNASQLAKPERPASPWLLSAMQPFVFEMYKPVNQCKCVPTAPVAYLGRDKLHQCLADVAHGRSLCNDSRAPGCLIASLLEGGAPHLGSLAVPVLTAGATLLAPACLSPSCLVFPTLKR